MLDMMATFFPTKQKPLQVSGVATMLDNGKLCVAFECGPSYITLHGVTADEVREFAAELVSAVEQAEAKTMAATK